MSIPDSLQDKLELFRTRGEVLPRPKDLFSETSWFAILYGQGLEPEGYHPLADSMSEDDLNIILARIRAAIRQRVAELPGHEQFLQRCCASSTPVAAARKPNGG